MVLRYVEHIVIYKMNALKETWDFAHTIQIKLQVDPHTVLRNKSFESGTSFGLGGKGNIFVVSAGNGGENFDSCAANWQANSIYTITMGALHQV